MKYLIVNADDFGASRGINRGILQTHLEGVVTSTSLMVNMPASEEAVELSRDLPELGVGLHVNFTNEGDAPVVDVADIEACQTELIFQFDRFLTLMGRLPTHLDAQHNIHRNPGLGELFLNLAGRHGLPLRDHSVARYLGDFYGQWNGESHPEQLTTESLKKILFEQVASGVTELSCHPGYVDLDFASEYNTEREAEVATLCDSSIPRILHDLDIRLISFADLPAVPGVESLRPHMRDHPT
jgi:predicted glycoside hydrolase/deacetylase ChbG (UPF0249 family)